MHEGRAQARRRAAHVRGGRPPRVRDRSRRPRRGAVAAARAAAGERGRARAADRPRSGRDRACARRARAARLRGRPRGRLPFHLLNPYWLEDPVVLPSSPRHEGRVDVAIIGAGVTGCSAALRLAEAGMRVRIHDARGIAEGASGRNGGFALRGGAARYDVARETYGDEHARELWRWTERALDRIADLAGDALRRIGSYRLAGDEEEREGIRLEYEALREDGFEAEWLDDVPGGAAGRFHGAIS